MQKKYKEILKDKEFLAKYKEIIEMMGFSEAEDIKSRNFLFEIFSQREYDLENNISYLKELFGKFTNVLIFGGGPDVEYFVNYIHNNNDFKKIPDNSLVIAVDGATELLYEKNIIPNMIFTDLDGITIDTINRPEFKKTSFIIHAHGDNINQIKLFRKFLNMSKFLIGTTQVESKIPIINHGGFTDGDRTLFLIKNFLKEYHNVFIFGFDFGDIIGKYSKPHLMSDQKVNSIKKRKLDIGAELKSIENFQSYRRTQK
jgi:uncharacterized Rossmann fold enzyme